MDFFDQLYPPVIYTKGTLEDEINYNLSLYNINKDIQLPHETPIGMYDNIYKTTQNKLNEEIIINDSREKQEIQPEGSKKNNIERSKYENDINNNLEVRGNNKRQDTSIEMINKYSKEKLDTKTTENITTTTNGKDLNGSRNKSVMNDSNKIENHPIEIKNKIEESLVKENKSSTIVNRESNSDNLFFDNFSMSSEAIPTKNSKPVETKKENSSRIFNLILGSNSLMFENDEFSDDLSYF